MEQLCFKHLKNTEYYIISIEMNSCGIPESILPFVLDKLPPRDINTALQVSSQWKSYAEFNKNNYLGSRRHKLAIMTKIEKYFDSIYLNNTHYYHDQYIILANDLLPLLYNNYNVFKKDYDLVVFFATYFYSSSVLHCGPCLFGKDVLINCDILVFNIWKTLHMFEKQRLTPKVCYMLRNMITKRSLKEII